jgi:hypothetical protein
MQPEQIRLRPTEPGGFSTPIAKESLGVPDQRQPIQWQHPGNRRCGFESLKSFSPLPRDAGVAITIPDAAISGEEIKQLLTSIAQSIENRSGDRLLSRLYDDPITLPANSGADACQKGE